jgi:alkanesulfonate monooxygenase SsuD/methylene tetrahydromethanopterin reductase-like flavin-dependent oxidoreductase (luciferase family)
VPEHALIPIHTNVPYPALDGKIPDAYTRFPDPFVLLGMMASVTRTLKLGTAICLVPAGQPLALAKEVATIDYFSGGRFLFGVGAGCKPKNPPSWAWNLPDARLSREIIYAQ